MSNVRSCPSSSSCASDPETIQHTLFECKASEKERGEFLERLYEFHPVARVAS